MVSFFCHIIMSFPDVGILFFKTVCYVGTQYIFKMIIANEARKIIHAMVTYDSDYVMTFTTAITSI